MRRGTYIVVTLARVMGNRTAPSVAEQRTEVIPARKRLSGDSGQNKF